MLRATFSANQFRVSTKRKRQMQGAQKLVRALSIVIKNVRKWTELVFFPIYFSVSQRWCNHSSVFMFSWFWFWRELYFEIKSMTWKAVFVCCWHGFRLKVSTRGREGQSVLHARPYKSLVLCKAKSTKAVAGTGVVRAWPTLVWSWVVGSVLGSLWVGWWPLTIRSIVPWCTWTVWSWLRVGAGWIFLGLEFEGGWGGAASLVSPAHWSVGSSQFEIRLGASGVSNTAACVICWVQKLDWDWVWWGKQYRRKKRQCGLSPAR